MPRLSVLLGAAEQPSERNTLDELGRTYATPTSEKDVPQTAATKSGGDVALISVMAL